MVTLPLNRARDILEIDLYTLTVVNLIISLQLVGTIVYIILTNPTFPGLRYFVIPFIWINLAGYAVMKTTPSTRGPRHTAIAFGIAAAYLLITLYLSGLLRPSGGALGQITGTAGFGVTWRSIGWGPTLLYSGELVSLVLIPYQVIGYLTLAYLLYGAILDITNSAVGGIVGLVSCPGCAAPLFTSFAAGLAGTSSALVLLATYQYELATVLFVTAVALLLQR